MNTSVTIDKTGRIVLPKTVRDGLHIAPGDTLELEVDGEQVMLRPKRPVPPLQKERGVWVFRSGEPLTAGQVGEVVQSLRDHLGHPTGDG